MGHTMHNWLVIITPQPSILCISQENDNNIHMHNTMAKLIPADGAKLQI